MSVRVKYVIGIFFLFMVFSCRDVSEKRNLVDLPDRIENEDRKVNLSSLLDFSVIPLSTPENGLLGDILKIIQKGDRFYILSQDQKISIYDRKGNLLQKISRQGKGGGQEYSMIKDFDIYGDNLIIMDYRCLLFCSLDGDYLYSKPFDFKGMNLKVVSDDEILFVTSEEDNIIYVTDLNGKIKNKYLPSTPSLRLHRQNPFLLSGDGVLFQKGFSNEYWRYVPSRKDQKDVYFIQEENTLTSSEEEDLLRQYGMDYFQYVNDIMTNALATYSDQFFLVWLGKDKNMNFALGDMATGKVKSYSRSNIEDDVTFNNLNFMGFASECRGEDAFISFVWPSAVTKGLDEFARKHPDRLSDDRYKQMKELMATTQEYANPFLIEYKFKL